MNDEKTTLHDRPQRELRTLFAPRSIALIGASDRNVFSMQGAANLKLAGYQGVAYAVNRGGQPAHGFPGYLSCRDIGAPVDAAYVAVPAEGVAAALEDGAAAGIRNFVLVSGGFAETGVEGLARQQAIAELCARENFNLLGPNCLGYFNLHASCAMGAITGTELPRPGNVAIISASGAVASQIMLFCRRQGIGVSHVIATGNEAVVSSADIIEYLVDEPQVRAIAIFFEAVQNAGDFARAALRARRAGKPIVVLKVGKTERTAAVANAHTGVLTGDDRVFDAVCEKFGVIRVDNFEDLAVTAGTIAATGPLTPAGAAFISTSGGVCEVIADLAEGCGLSIPDFSGPVRDHLAGLVSALGQLNNPLDLTGTVARNPGLWEDVILEIAKDTQIGPIIAHMDLPSQWQDTPTVNAVFGHIANALNKVRPRGLLLSTYVAPLDERDRKFLDSAGIDMVLPSLTSGISALAKLTQWSAQFADNPTPEATAPKTALLANLPCDDIALFALLAAHKVAVAAPVFCNSREAAITASDAIIGPVVLKIASPQIQRKSDAGGVLLNLHGAAAVAQGFDTIMTSVARHMPDAERLGVTVSPMRGGTGIELLVGVKRDPQWGLVLTLGFGGVLTEILQDIAVLLLPAGRTEIIRALRKLRGARLFDGYRGAPATDLDGLATTITRIIEAVQTLGPALELLEINPLQVNGAESCVLDVLVQWRSDVGPA